MWCGCGSSRPQTRHEGPISTPRTAVTWTFLGADDGIRTRDPNLGKVLTWVFVVIPSPLACDCVHPVSRKSTESSPVVERSTRSPEPRSHRGEQTLRAHRAPSDPEEFEPTLRGLLMTSPLPAEMWTDLGFQCWTTSTTLHGFSTSHGRRRTRFGAMVVAALSARRLRSADQ